MSNIDKAIKHLNRKISEREHSQTISFDEFLKILTDTAGRRLCATFSRPFTT